MESLDYSLAYSYTTIVLAKRTQFPVSVELHKTLNLNNPMLNTILGKLWRNGTINYTKI